MTKGEWIDVIKNTMAKVDEQGVYRRPLIERHIQSVYEQMYNELYPSEKNSFSKYTSLVTQSSVSDANMASGVTITTLPIALPRANSGVFDFYIGVKKFVLTSYEGLQSVVDESFDTAGWKGKYFASVLKNKVYGNTTTGGTLAVPTTLTFRMIPKFTSLALTDEVMIPGGGEDHFIDRIIDTIKHFRPTDLINDNTIR